VQSTYTRTQNLTWNTRNVFFLEFTHTHTAPHPNHLAAPETTNSGGVTEEVAAVAAGLHIEGVELRAQLLADREALAKFILVDGSELGEFVLVVGLVLLGNIFDVPDHRELTVVVDLAAADGVGEADNQADDELEIGFVFDVHDSGGVLEGGSVVALSSGGGVEPIGVDWVSVNIIIKELKQCFEDRVLAVFFAVQSVDHCLWKRNVGFEMAFQTWLVIYTVVGHRIVRVGHQERPPGVGFASGILGNQAPQLANLEVFVGDLEVGMGLRCKLVALCSRTDTTSLEAKYSLLADVHGTRVSVTIDAPTIEVTIDATGMDRCSEGTHIGGITRVTTNLSGNEHAVSRGSVVVEVGTVHRGTLELHGSSGAAAISSLYVGTLGLVEKGVVAEHLSIHHVVHHGELVDELLLPGFAGVNGCGEVADEVGGRIGAAVGTDGVHEAVVVEDLLHLGEILEQLVEELANGSAHALGLLGVLLERLLLSHTHAVVLGNTLLLARESGVLALGRKLLHDAGHLSTNLVLLRLDDGVEGSTVRKATGHGYVLLRRGRRRKDAGSRRGEGGWGGLV